MLSNPNTDFSTTFSDGGSPGTDKIIDTDTS
jgi:hypothetical protein